MYFWVESCLSFMPVYADCDHGKENHFLLWRFPNSRLRRETCMSGSSTDSKPVNALNPKTDEYYFGGVFAKLSLWIDLFDNSIKTSLSQRMFFFFVWLLKLYLRNTCHPRADARRETSQPNHREKKKETKRFFKLRNFKEVGWEKEKGSPERPRKGGSHSKNNGVVLKRELYLNMVPNYYKWQEKLHLVIPINSFCSYSSFQVLFKVQLNVKYV